MNKLQPTQRNSEIHTYVINKKKEKIINQIQSQ